MSGITRGHEETCKSQSQIDVEFDSVTKNYGKVRAVDNFSLKVEKGSFTTLLGPSGCGKTTLLRIAAGFFECDRGEMIIAGINQRGIPPEKRSTGIVFQDYALFPHMTAAENLAYGLTIRNRDRKMKAQAIQDEVERTAGTLGLGGLLGRYPGELSGGQQQRLALGRVIILKPRILLMDEPLSSLDAKLRFLVREELKDIQRRLGITTLYVTHDQEEALSLSDYIAVMNSGRLEQAGTPKELYNFPRTAFAADFTGPANFITLNGKRYMIRPEWMDLGDGRGEFAFTGRVTGADYYGRFTRLKVEPAGDASPPFKSNGPLAVDVPGGEGPGTGNRVRVVVKTAREIGE
ncbi:MAG: ABC transporter ATP-binding protein [Treponema sp.]|nr:ABC transporter ATP-binding protein [Treponema sp.]